MARRTYSGLPEGDDSRSEKEEHLDRRGFMKYGLTAATGVFAASLGAIGYASILMPGGGGGAGDLAVKYWVPKGQEDSAWYASKHDTPMLVSELENEAASTVTGMAGAQGVWNGLPVNVVYVPDTKHSGTPVKDNKPRFQYLEGSDASGKVIGHGEDVRDDPAAPHDNLAVIFSRCPHLCCIPGWRLVSNDFTNDTWASGGTDSGGCKLFCICHSSRFDPTVVEINRNRTSSGSQVDYIGIRRVGGPAPVGMPFIPFDIESDMIVGRTDHLEWYTFCD